MTDGGDEAVKRWALAEITYDVDIDKYIHKSICTCFSKDGIDKRFAITQGLEWTGEDSIDDYC